MVAAVIEVNNQIQNDSVVLVDGKSGDSVGPISLTPGEHDTTTSLRNAINTDPSASSRVPVTRRLSF